MNKKYYFDTSIWLDLFENRDEEHLPKGKYAWELMKKIIVEDAVIVYSDFIITELIEGYGYPPYKAEALFQPFQRIIFFVYSTEKQNTKAQDLSAKRKIPFGDALHAFIARDCQAQLVTRDKDFQKLIDIILTKKPEELIQD